MGRASWWNLRNRGEKMSRRSLGRFRPHLEMLEDRRLLATRIWTGLGGNTLWSNPGNWDGGLPIGAFDDLQFPTGPSNLTSAQDFGNGFPVSSILISGSGYDITCINNFVTAVSNGLTASNASGSNTISTPLDLPNSQAITTSNAGATLRFTRRVTAIGGANLLVAGSGDTAFQDFVASSTPVTKNGTGTMSYNNATFMPVTFANAGTVLSNSLTFPNSHVQVNTNGVLSGTGFAGQVGVFGGTVNPGALNSVGILSVDSLFSANGFATNSIKVQMNGTTTAGTHYDRLVVANFLDLTQPTTLVVDLDGLTAGGLATGVIQYGNLLGTFSTVTVINNSLGASVSLIYQPNSLDIRVSRPPVAQADNYTTLEDTMLEIAVPGVAWNDSDPDGDTFLTVPVSPPIHGNLQLQPDGSFKYTPFANYFGGDSFVYRLFEPATGLFSSPVIVYLQVLSINDPPVADQQGYGMQEDQTMQIDANFGVLNGDTDADLDTLTATLVLLPLHFRNFGLNSDGSFLYEPLPDFNGNDAFLYEVSDGKGGADYQWVQINIGAKNDPPVAVNIVDYIDEDEFLVSFLQVSDIDTNQTFTFTIESQGTLGNAVVTNPNTGAFTYTPLPDVSGSDSFVFRVTDQDGDFATATVMVTIAPVDDDCDAGPDNYEVAEDTPLVVDALNGVLANDTDIDGPLPLFGFIISGPSNGSIAMTPDGAFTYTPDPNFSGTDTIVYACCSGRHIKEGVITMNVTPVNDPPVATAYYVPQFEDLLVTSFVLATDVEDSNADLVYAAETLPQHGTLSFQPDGNYTYMPDPHYNGEDSFSYRVTDSDGDQATATVAFDLAPVNDAPVAVNDSYSVNEDSMLLVPATNGVLFNDTDPLDGPLIAQALFQRLVPQPPQFGQLLWHGDGGFLYIPNLHFAGQDSFTYIASDGLDSNVATVTIDVLPVANDPPVAVPDNHLALIEDELYMVFAASSVLANDQNPDGTPLTAQLVVAPRHGTLNLSSDGTFTYDPFDDYFGPDDFYYQAVNAAGVSNLGRVSLFINPINDSPVAVQDFEKNTENVSGGFGLIGLLDNDTDVDNPPNELFILSITQPANGTAMLNPNGTVTYFPRPLFFGNDSFTYTLSDGDGGTAIGLCLLEIHAVTYVSFTSTAFLEECDDGDPIVGDGCTVGAMDIVCFEMPPGPDRFMSDPSTGACYVAFSGRDVGLTTGQENIDAFTFLGDGSIVISTKGRFVLDTTYENGVGTGPVLTGSGWDLLKFTPTKLGLDTDGTWSIYFRGQPVGLSGSAENIDGVAVLPNGHLIISVTGKASLVGAVAGLDEDLFEFSPTALGESTNGTWSFLFDGSAVGLGDSGAEDVKALFVYPGSSGDLTPMEEVSFSFATVGNFAVQGLAGVNDDIFTFHPTALGAATAGTFGPGLQADGSTGLLDPFSIDGVFLGQANIQSVYVPGGTLSTRSARSHRSADQVAALVSAVRDQKPPEKLSNVYQSRRTVTGVSDLSRQRHAIVDAFFLAPPTAKRSALRSHFLSVEESLGV